MITDEKKIDSDEVNSEEFYYNNIKNYPVLTIEEEHELGKRIKEGDNEALNKLIQCNLRLVYSIAKKYERDLKNTGVDIMDIIQNGNIGLMRAAQKYDYLRDNRFSTYASLWIKTAIDRNLPYQTEHIKIPVHLQEQRYMMKKHAENFIKEYGRNPTSEELEKITGLKKEQIQELKQIERYSTLSLDAPITNEEDDEFRSLGDYIASNDKSTEEICIQNGTREDIQKILENLTEKQKKFINLRFGLTGENPKTLSEIGQIFHVSRESARRTEIATFKALRHPKIKAMLREYTKD